MTAANGTPVERSVALLGRNVRLLEAGQGRPLVVLHHSTGNPGWLPFYEELARHFWVIVPDLPGYGQSERPEWARDARDMAILAIKLIETLGLTGVTLVGLGFGGFIGAELAAMNATRLAALVLIGAAGLKPAEGEILDQMMVDFAEYVQTGFRDQAAYDAVFEEQAAADLRDLWDYSREMTARLTWKPYMFDRRLPHLLGAIDVPALVIWGGADRIVPPVCGRQYAAGLPNARLELFDGAGHLVELEEPQRVAQLIMEHAHGLQK